MEILSARYITSSPEYKKCPEPDRPEFAFIGRSNVGKSSLINMICDHKNLAKTSVTPGKTQLINHFEIISSDPGNKRKQKLSWYLVDLPGYGYAVKDQKSRKQWQQMTEQFIRERKNLSCLFVLIDSRHKPQPIDIEFLNKLEKWKLPFALVFTKADKNKPGIAKKNAEMFLREAGLGAGRGFPFFITSAISKTGRQALLEYMASLLKEIPGSF
jgi:GTP-binding protein